ncbi:hypothetical protein ANCCEY_13873 [Ancylostoma ceylanicum]|uniref:Uncharacterized protein n=1 Tax=Ancylostoma ceylanicum TaxID=53326 RepID=A0A0D6L6I9_9BILA|nr:hypothetical protein ANCCEY_13873 [Ancylostoma ceylanicum]
MHGRDPQLISDAVLRYPRRMFGDPESYKTEIIANIFNAWSTNKTRIEKATNIYKSNYDKQCRQQGEITLGDLVLLRNDGNHSKFELSWKGPYRVIQIAKPNVTLQMLGNPANIEIVHSNRTKKYEDRHVPNLITPPETPLPNEATDEDTPNVRRSTRIQNQRIPLSY